MTQEQEQWKKRRPFYDFNYRNLSKSIQVNRRGTFSAKNPDYRSQLSLSLSLCLSAFSVVLRRRVIDSLRLSTPRTLIKMDRYFRLHPFSSHRDPPLVRQHPIGIPAQSRDADYAHTCTQQRAPSYYKFARFARSGIPIPARGCQDKWAWLVECSVYRVMAPRFFSQHPLAVLPQHVRVSMIAGSVKKMSLKRQHHPRDSHR